jgi:hypothetical protein
MVVKLDLTLSEEHRLKVFEKSMLRRICAPKRRGKRPLERPRHRWEDGVKNGS